MLTRTHLTIRTSTLALTALCASLARAEGVPAEATATDEPMDRMPPSVFGPPITTRDDDEARRERPLQESLGPKPTRPDFGSEADLVSTVNEPRAPAFTKKWSYSLGGFLRAPMRIGYGPRNDGTEGGELHAPPRVPGASEYSFTYTGLAPNPTASLYLTVENARVSGNVVLTADTFYDAGYDHLDEIGGVGQAYVTLKFPEAFEPAGGLSWTIGAFSNRYGMAGPRQQSAGYYETYLFGRTHVAGETLTADVDLSDDVQLVLEHGFGAKLESVPFTNLSSGPPIAPYVPQQGPVPLGSNFVHHAHAAVLFSDTVRVAGHYLHSWSPNDFVTLQMQPVEVQTGQEQIAEASLQIFGGEVHLDSPTYGHGYVGFSHIVAKDVLPLSDGVEVLHSRNGWGLKENYFGTLPDDYFRQGTSPALLPPADDDGTVSALLFQYILRLRPLLGYERDGRDVAVAVFGMLANAHAEEQNRNQTKVKGGAEVSVGLTQHISAGFRFDQVMDDGGNPDYQHQVVTPKFVFHSKWISREYVVLSYSRYFLGAGVEPTTFYDHPYRIPVAPNPADPSASASPRLPVPEPDENMINLAAIVAF